MRCCELPEVELVSRALAAHCLGRKVVSAKLLRPGLAPETTPVTFARRLNGGKFERISRRGKHILLEFDRRYALLAHLRMTGRFQLLPPGYPLPAHTPAFFKIDDGRRLIFTDQRHFGMMRLVEADKIHHARELKSLAPEPFSPEFSDDYLVETLRSTTRTLKEALLDQTKVSGLGNIYAAEAMFLAGVNPSLSAFRLSRARVARLRTAILEVLRASILHGSTLNVDPENLEQSYYGGGYHGKWHVYNREGEPCSRCDSAIKRTVHGARSTYYCQKCQR
ncbi:MAG: bifunctional DNA-formamidopyrimidine glycosylase/DNA-(apurinic or apyrimidinic site) lyase [Pyrinomonadaceae bacterium]